MKPYLHIKPKACAQFWVTPFEKGERNDNEIIFEDGLKELGLFSPRTAQAITTACKNGRNIFLSITICGRRRSLKFEQ